jgi:hypothetical protein
MFPLGFIIGGECGMDSVKKNAGRAKGGETSLPARKLNSYHHKRRRKEKVTHGIAALVGKSGNR